MTHALIALTEDDQKKALPVGQCFYNFMSLIEK